jgi:hypothetical protein
VAYSVSVVKRTPTQSSTPTLVEVGPILDPSGLSWSDELNRETEASVSCDPRLLSEPVKVQIREDLDDDSDTPGLELWIYRDSVRVFEGPIVGYQIQGEANTLTVTARGLLYYLRGMWLLADFAQTDDQYDIGKMLVDQWQAEDYGHFGIDTSGIGTSGTNRQRTWLAHEQHNVFQRLSELADVNGGFDYWVENETRDLEFAAARGTDLSATVFLDRRGVVDPGIAVSKAAGSFASTAFASSSGDMVLTSSDVDATLRQSFGYWGHAETFDGVTVQATLDDHAARLLADRNRVMFVPAPSVIPVSGSSPTAFDPGDTIEFSYDFGVGTVTVQRRVLKKQVSVGDEGQEDMGVAFA